MKKTIKFIIFSLLFLLSGCASRETIKVSNNLDLQPVKTNQEIEQQQVTIPPDWKIYKNDEIGFEVKYPQNWVYQEFREGTKVGKKNTPKNVTGIWFGTPESKPGGYIWAINFYNRSQDIETVIAQDGNQFSDRQEKRKNIKFNGIEGLYTTVITKQYPNWISETIYFTKDDKLFEISNGAIPNKEFELFYNGFKWID